MKKSLTVSQTYFLFMFFFDFGLSWCSTTLVPGLQKLGITMAQIGLMESIFWGFVLVSEIPSGLYADRFSRVRALFVSSVVLCVGGVLYMTATGFVHAVIAELTLGVGMSIGGNSLRSWVMSAIAHEQNDQPADELRLTKLFGTSQVLRSAVALCAGALGACVPSPTQVSIWLPLIIGNLLNLGLVVTVMRHYHEAPRVHLSHKETLKKGFAHFVNNKALIWIMVSASIFGMLVPYYNYWTLYFRAAVGEGNMSFVWIWSFLPVMAGGWMVRRFGHGTMSEKGAIIATLVLPALSVAVLAQTDCVPTQIGVLALLQLGRGMFQPLSEIFIARRVEDSVRTTTLAIISTLSKVVCVLFPALVYQLTSDMPDGVPLIRMIWTATSSCMIVSLCMLWLLRPRSS
ncbi:MAG: MFS transporter [Patescibacteria group bacterium]